MVICSCSTESNQISADTEFGCLLKCRAVQNASGTPSPVIPSDLNLNGDRLSDFSMVGILRPLEDKISLLEKRIKQIYMLGVGNLIIVIFVFIILLLVLIYSRKGNTKTIQKV